MSFGYSVGDVLAVGQLCWKVYKKCKDSPGNYAELASEVGALHNVVKETEELLSQQALTSKQENKLLACRQGCESVLKDLDGLLVKYESLGTNARRTFDRMGFGVQDMKDIRLRLISNVSMLDAFNNLSSQARLENKMNILIAEVRAGKREGSVISTKTFDATVQVDRDTWEALRRDLEDVGISSDVITEKRQFIIAWFQEAIAAGKLEEDPPSDDEDIAVSEFGSDGAIDESGSGSIYQRDIASMMIEPTTSEEDTGNISVPNVQRSLREPNETIKSTRGPTKVQPSEGKRKPRIGISYLFEKLGWKNDKLDWRSKQFLEAAIAGDVARVIVSLEKGVDIEYKDNERRTALALATSKGNEPVVRLLLERGANPEFEHSRGETTLTVAAFSGLLSVTQLLLENGAYIESRNMSSDTPLIVATRQGHQSVVRLLLEKGAYVESRNLFSETSLILAASNGHDSLVQVLLEKGANIESLTYDGETPLTRAAGAGHESTVQVLLEKGANIESAGSTTPLTSAAGKGRESTVRVLLEKGANIESVDIYGRTPLTSAAEAGHESTVQVLLEKGANIESVVNGETPLTRAAGAGHESTVQVLLEKGANIESVVDGETPLTRAAGAGHESIVRVLLEKGANIESVASNGETPLIHAVGAGYESTVRVLLEKGANIESVASNGKTSLMFAARAGYFLVVQALLEKGANVHARDMSGRNALYYTRHNEKIAQLLRSAGAKD